ncbi:MAG TPA: hypothetical protein VJQ06_10300 [Rhizomicrobium sp.]|nr:hypothetical protein [Rhizomicrobium sp.]
MVTLPRTPQAWDDQSAAAPQETPPPDSDLSNDSRGLLDGWRSPAWSLESSGLSFVLHPQTIAQIDFGDRQDPHAVQPMAGHIADNMATGNIATGNLAAGADPAQAQNTGQDNDNSAVFMTSPKAPLPSVISGANTNSRNKSATAPKDGLTLGANGNATAAADRRSSRLGSLSARYESHGNPGTVSSGRDDPGGISYGTYQFATNTRDAAAFVASPEFRPWAREFENLTPATAAFGNQWQAVAARDPDAFQQAQHAYIRRTHYDPVASQVNRDTGYDLDNASDAVRDAAWSASVQHSAAARILIDALRRTDQALPRTDPNYESRLIDNIYDRRTEYVTGVRNRAIAENRVGDAETLNSVINNRYPRERADAQSMLRNQQRR